MPNLLDALMIEVGFDTTKLIKGQKEAVSSFNKTKDDIKKAGAGIEKSAKDMTEGLSKATQGVLDLTAAFLGARGLKEFVNDATRANTSLGNLGASLGSSPQLISAWSMAAERMGGSAGATQASIQSLSDALVDFRTQGKALPDALFQLEAKSGKNVDFQHGWQKMAIDVADAASTLAKTDPAAADRFLRLLGLDPVTAQILIQQGPRMQAYLSMLQKYAPSQTDISAAKGMSDAWGKLENQFSQLATKIGTAIAPMLQFLADKIGALVESMSALVQAHPHFTEAITGVIGLLSAGGILVAIKNIVALRSALLGLSEANAASSSVGMLGMLARLGVVGAGAAALAAVMNPTDLNDGEDEIARQRRFGQNPGGGSGNEALRRRGTVGKALGSLARNENANAAIDELRKAGYNNNAIAAIIGSMQTESTFNPRAHNSVAGGHTGAWQWDSTRWPKIAAWIKSHGGDPLDYRWQTKAWIAEHNAKPGDAIYDTQKTEAGGAILRSNPSLAGAVHGVQISERFGVGEEGGRAANAANWLPHLASPTVASNTLWTGGLAGARSAFGRGGAAHAAALSNIANDHRVTTSSSSNEMHVGTLNVNAPQATDAKGIAGHIDSALADKFFARQADHGPY